MSGDKLIGVFQKVVFVRKVTETNIFLFLLLNRFTLPLCDSEKNQECCSTN